MSESISRNNNFIFITTKTTPTLFKLADIFEVLNERKDLDDFSVPADSRLQASLRRLDLASTLIPIIGICPLINHIKRSWKHAHKINRNQT
jgi:hypothetical protein